MTQATRNLITAAKVLLMTHPVFRLKPMGGEGSPARRQQEDQIAAEDALVDALQAVEKESLSHFAGSVP